MGSGLFRCCSPCIECLNRPLSGNSICPANFGSTSDFDQLQHHFQPESEVADFNANGSSNRFHHIPGSSSFKCRYVVFAQKSYHRQHWLNRQRSVLSNNFALDVIPSVRRLDSIRSKFQCRNQSFVAEQNGMLTHSKWLDPAWPNAQEVPLLLPLKNDQHPTNSLFLDHSISSDLKTQTRQCDLSLIAFDRTISDEAATDESIVEVASNHLDPDYLEWDSYEEDTIAIHNETEQLILEIDEITKGRYTRSCAFD